MSEPEQKKMEVRYLKVEAAFHGQRIDNYLVNLLKGVPRSFIYRVLRRGEVRVNKGRKPASYRVQEGDLLRIPPVRAGEQKVLQFDSRLLEGLGQAILYEDDRLVVLNKPAGLAVHGGSGLRFGVIEGMRRLRPMEKQLELVHRLDRDTSGCLLISKRRSTLRTLHEMLRNNGIDKRYLALVAGSWPKDRMTVNAPLIKNILQSGERMVQVDPLGKAAVSRFTVRQRFASSMLVEAELVTGRTHQIRVHAAQLGTPILGDPKYGDNASNHAWRALGLKRMFLHAESISFHWPDQQRQLRFVAPLESSLERLLDRLGSDHG